MRIAIYPGSFDPLTNGHLDLIERAAKLFDRVIVAVAINSTKSPLFTFEERKQLVAGAIKEMTNVQVDGFEGLLVDYAKRCNGQAIIRGLRAVADFEYEFQMALMNRNLDEEIETIFMMPKDSYTFISSSIVKEVARLNGEIGTFVPPNVRIALKEKMAQH